jgi:hypothetical protein
MHIVKLVTRLSNGSVSIDGGRVVYVSSAGYVGDDHFTYAQQGLNALNRPIARTVVMNVRVSARLGAPWRCRCRSNHCLSLLPICSALSRFSASRTSDRRLGAVTCWRWPWRSRQPSAVDVRSSRLSGRGMILGHQVSHASDQPGHVGHARRERRSIAR